MILLLGLLLPGRELKAQDVLMSRPQVPVTPPAMQQYETNNEMIVFAPAGAALLSGGSPFKWGPVTVRPHVYYQFTYGEGIPAGATNTGTSTNLVLVDTTIHEFSPGVLFVLGRHWTLDYTPTWRFFSSSRFENTLDHGARLAGGTTYEDWVLGLVQTYSSSSTPLVETGSQTDQETYVTTLTASYEINSKMSLDLAVEQNFSFAETTGGGTNDLTLFTSSGYREWSTIDWLNYQFWPRLAAGVGVGLGFVDQLDEGSDMTYEQLQARINWRATDKISFQLHGGVEVRQFLDTGTNNAGNLVNPIVGGTIQYQPFEVTKLSFGISRAIEPSYLQSQAKESTEIAVDFSQRLLGRLYLGLGGRYQNVAYTAADGDSSRTDDFFTFNSSLSCQILKRGSISIFYLYSNNSSSEAGAGFTSRQVGVEVGYAF